LGGLKTEQESKARKGDEGKLPTTIIVGRKKTMKRSVLLGRTGSEDRGKTVSELCGAC